MARPNVGLVPDSSFAENGPAASTGVGGWALVAGLTTVAGCLAWSYWSTLLTMEDRWSHDPQYSHGFLVPLFAGVVLWHRRDLVPRNLATSWWGLAWLLGGMAMRLAGASRQQETLDGLSLLPSLVGLSLLIGGKQALQWAWPAIAFLGFMLPLPFAVEGTLAQPLRRVATISSTYCLQLAGYPALMEGNIIHIDDVKLGVIEACSGLGMLMTFFALSTAVAIVIQRRWADKLAIVASAIPIAVIANVARISATGVVHCSFGEGAGHFFHDWAGWLMMPLALSLLWLELQFFGRLVVDDTEEEVAGPLDLDFTGAVRALPYPRKEGEPLPCDWVPRSADRQEQKTDTSEVLQP
jgi:exosortase